LLTLVSQRQIQRHYLQEAYRVHSANEKAVEEPDDKQLEKAMELLCQKEVE